jgi:integrase
MKDPGKLNKTAKNQPKLQFSKTVFTSAFGTVRVYVLRHINGCPSTDPNDQRCPCPKHIYFKPRMGADGRLSARTPSYTEACEIAQKMLRGFDPEIRAAREQQAAAIIERGITVEAAIELYIKGVRSRNRSAGYMNSVRLIFVRNRPHQNRKSKPVKNISLLDFLDRQFHRTVYMSEITVDLADEWAAEWVSNDLGFRSRRSLARSFFRWAHDRDYLGQIPFGGRYKVKRGNRCGHFTAEQYAQLMATIPFYRWRSGPKMPENYVERLGAFCDLGRWGGAAVADIVNFRPAENLAADSNILTYRRQKTELMATVLLPAEVARRLRHVPAEAGSLADQPFRFAGTKETTDRSLWRDRFQQLCAQAGITEITTEVGTRRKPHPHMLRDTLAIMAIENGAPSDDIAEMLGHADTQMTQRAYTLWTTKRRAASIERQAAVLARMQVTPAPDAGAREDDRRLRRTLVH